MNKKGSILLSLLASLLLLGIILFFVFRIDGEESKNTSESIESTIQNGVEDANVTLIYAYISSVELEITKQLLYDNNFVQGKYSVLQIDSMYTLSLRSDKPSEGNMCISSNGTITKGSFKLNNYVISYNGKNAKVTQLTSVEDINCF